MGIWDKLKKIVVDDVKSDPLQTDLQPQEEEDSGRPPGVSLFIGNSTGELCSRGHASGLWPDQAVWLSNDDCCQNICVMGGIGAGKTTRVINPLLFQLLGYGGEDGFHQGKGFYNKPVGGLIFDIKGDFVESVQSFANFVGRDVIRIGVGDDCRGTNLLKGLSPEQAAGFLQSTFYLTGGTMTDSFWIQSATSLIQNVLGLISALGDEYYNLQSLYQYIFFDDAREAMNTLLDKDIHYEEGSLEDRNYKNYRGYYDNVFMRMDIKMRESIKGTLSTILAPFQNPELIDAFSGTNDDYDIQGIISGDIVLVDLPLAKWTTAGKVVYTLIKLRFFNLLQLRQVDKSMPQNFTFFLCDEYQNIISASKEGLSDLSFWDKSRSAHVIGIISTQSVSSFRSAIGNPQLCDTILANFRQKIFFRSEDIETIRYMNQLAGRVEVTRSSYNHSTGTSNNSNPQGGFMAAFVGSSGTTTNNSVNYQTVERQLIDANLVRQLSGNLALAFLSVEGGSADDVLVMSPLYPGSPQNIAKQLGWDVGDDDEQS